MPTYEYACDACGHEFELFHSMKDDPISKCPECKKKKVRRLLGSGAGIIFKGSGFYETDYKRKESKQESKSDTSGGENGKSKSPDSKTEGKSESKSEKKSGEKSTANTKKPAA